MLPFVRPLPFRGHLSTLIVSAALLLPSSAQAEISGKQIDALSRSSGNAKTGLIMQDREAGTKTSAPALREPPGRSVVTCVAGCSGGVPATVYDAPAVPTAPDVIAASNAPVIASLNVITCVAGCSSDTSPYASERSTPPVSVAMAHRGTRPVRILALEHSDPIHVTSPRSRTAAAVHDHRHHHAAAATAPQAHAYAGFRHHSANIVVRYVTY